MGSTRVEAPAPRNIAQEAGETLATQINLAPQQLDAYQRTAPGYAQTDLAVLGQSLFGEGWEGTLTDINRRLTDEAALQTRSANTAQRQADLADVERFSPQVQSAQRSANSELFGNLDRLDRAATAGAMPGSAEIAFNNAALAGPTGMYEPGYQGASYRPERVSNAMSAVAAPSAIEASLERQALGELSLGDQLSADEARQVRVQSRAAADARGRGFSNAALADEVLNTSMARQARADARRGFALNANAAVRSGQAADRGYGLARDQFRAGIDQFNATQGFNAAQLAQQDRQFAANLGLTAAQFNASRRDQANGLLAQAGQMEAGRRGETFGRQLSATQARLATYQDPFMGVLGRPSANVGTNANLFGNAVGTAGASAQQTRGMFDPFNGYASDLYNTNYNADAAARIATANNRAALTGSIIGGIGMLGAGALAGAGAAAAGGGTLFGGLCWVARAVYGSSSPRWTQFRAWLLSRAPDELLARYMARGRAAAARVQRDPVYRAELRRLMDAVLALPAHA